MKITFTLDDVLRAKTLQFGKIYTKYIDPELELETLDVSSGDLYKIFNFPTKDDFNRFLYEDYVFEIFGEAPICEKMLDKSLNMWQLRLSDDDELKEPIELAITSPREFNLSIGNTLFFLSKLATRIRNISFPTDSMEIWDNTDVLVTADQTLLSSKPDGKTAIKIITDYNRDIPADYEYEKLSDFLKDNEIIKKLQGE